MPSEAAQSRSTVRFLGRVLGDVIRAQDGQAVFDQIEAIRKASVDFHRREAGGGGIGVEDRLAALSLEETVRFAHSFACFLQITNLAEDQIQHRRAAVGDEQADSLAGSIRALAGEGVGRAEVTALLARARIAPVITAHPSEVRRKSVLDRQGAITDELERHAAARTDAERAAIERELFREVSIFWRTRLLRTAKIAVSDEIENAVSYFERSFLEALPALYGHWEDVLGERPPSFLRIDSWVGGDRDGNPFVTAQVMRRALVAAIGGGAAPLSRRRPCARRGAFDLIGIWRRSRRSCGRWRRPRATPRRIGRTSPIAWP